MKLSDLLSADIDAIELEMDSSGSYRVIFSDKELIEVNAFLKSDMERTHDDWVPLWNRSVDNKEAYRTTKIPIPDGGRSIYPAPISRIPADQIIASVYNGIMRPRPIFSIDAYLKMEYDVPGQQIPVPPMGMMPGMPPPNIVSAEKQTAELVAHRMEQGYDFVVRERINLGPKLMRGVKGAVTGTPYWWKVVVDPEKHTSYGAKASGGVIDLDDKYEETKMRGDIMRWYLVPFTNGMMPLEYLYDENGIDRSPWFAERKPMRPDELAKKYAAGELFLVNDDAAALKLAQTTVDLVDEFRARGDASTERKTPASPIQSVPNWLTWFYWDCKYIDPLEPTDQDGKKKWKIKRLSLLGDFHLGTGQLMTCWLNSYEHRCRPYELVDQMDDGDCTVDRMMYHQTMFTYLAQSEIKGAHIANTPLYWHDPNLPDLAAFFASHKTINAGDHVPGIFGKEWGLTPAGEKHYSAIELLKFILSMSQLDSRENDFTMGGRPPGRTPAATTAAVYQHAEEVKTMFLARLSLKLSRLLRLDAETRRQYQPLGEVLPMWDETSKATIELPFRFPVGDVLDNFRIALTASDEALSEEKDPQQIMMRKQAVMADGEYVAKVVAAIVNIQQPLPQSAVSLFAQIVMRDQQLMRKLMGQMVTDEESYDLTPQLEALIAERNQALVMQQAQAQAAGGMNVQGGAGGSQQAPSAGGQPAGPGQSQGTQGQPPVPPNGPPPPAPVSGAVNQPPVQ